MGLVVGISKTHSAKIAAELLVESCLVETLVLEGSLLKLVSLSCLWGFPKASSKKPLKAYWLKASLFNLLRLRAALLSYSVGVVVQVPIDILQK